MKIKIRVWDKQEKKMIEHNSQDMVFIPCIDSLGADTHIDAKKYLAKKYKESDEYLSLFDWASADLIGGRYIMMLWTGLEDSGGKEIYSGDIVENKHQVRKLVRWNTKRCGWNIYANKVWKVVGHKHENC